MATKIAAVNNDSDSPAAYLGKDASTPTGWRAYGFAPAKRDDFGWMVTFEPRDQMIFTYAAGAYIWDNGNWQILEQRPGQSKAAVLITLEHKADPEIVITIAGDGSLSAEQL